MKKTFLLIAIMSLLGCQPPVQPKGLAITIDKNRTKSLVSGLRDYKADLKESEVSVRVVKSGEDVTKCLDWAEANGIKMIIMDGESIRLGGPILSPRVKSMVKDGFYIPAMEFA